MTVSYYIPSPMIENRTMCQVERNRRPCSNSYTALKIRVSTTHVNKVIIGDRFVKSELP